MATDYSLRNGAGIYSRSSIYQNSRSESGAPLALTEGSSFRGSVTNITPNNVTITTSTGKTIVARYDSKAELSIGDTAEFLVTGNEKGVITLKKTDLAQSTTNLNGISSAAMKALLGAELPFTERNINLVQTLLKYNMPVGKEALLTMNKFLAKFDSANPSTIITMMHSGLEITNESIRQFENYSAMRGQIAGMIDSTKEEVFSLLDSMTNTGNYISSRQIHSFTDSFFDIFNAAEIDDELSVPTTINAVYFEEAAKDALYDGVLTLSTQNEEAKSEGVFDRLRNYFTDLLTPAGEEAPQGTFITAGEDGGVTLSLSGSTAKPESLYIPPLDINELPYNTITDEEANDYLSFLMTKSDFTLYTGNEMPTLLDLSSATLQVQNSLTGDDLKELVSQPVFRKLLNNLIEKNWALDPHSPLDKKQIKELYERINSEAGKLKNLAESYGRQGRSLANVTEGIRQNINFMNNLNSVYTYLQLPLTMTQGTKSGELYVFTDKQKLKSKGGGQLSCLLHLDMTSLGKTDVYISLDGIKVNARFKVDDPVSARLITSHIDELDKAIDFHGYDFTCSVLKEDEELKDFDFVRSFIDRDIPEVSVQRYTFDVRA